MATGTKQTMQVPVDTGIDNLYAVKTGKLVTLYTHDNGVASIPTSGKQLPSSLYPKYQIKIYIPCYTNDWTSCRLEIGIDGKMKPWSGAVGISVNYAPFSVTYELANP